MSVCVTWVNADIPTVYRAELWASAPGWLPEHPKPALYLAEETTEVGQYPNVINFWTPRSIAITADRAYAVKFYDRAGTLLAETDAREYFQPAIENTKELGMKYILQEFVRRHNLIMKWDGELCALLIRKIRGTRCTCYDQFTHRQASGRCEKCYGVGWLGGYDLFTGARVRIRPHEKTIKRIPEGLIIDALPSAWTVSSPILKNGDIIVRRSGKRYMVQNMSLNQHQEISTIQQFTTDELEVTDMAYSIPLFTRVGVQSLVPVDEIGGQIAAYSAPPQETAMLRYGLYPERAILAMVPTEPTLQQVTGSNRSWNELVYTDSVALTGLWRISAATSKNFRGGPLTFRINWRAAAITGKVKWGVKLAKYSAGDSVDTVLGSQREFPLTSPVAISDYVSQISLTFVPSDAELTAGSDLIVAVTRIGTDVDDTLVGDAKLLSVDIWEN